MVPASWVKNTIRACDEHALASILRVNEATESAGLDELDLDVDQLHWYMIGGYESINQLLRVRDPRQLRLGGHFDQPWLRERVRDAVRQIDGLPRVSLPAPLTVHRAVEIPALGADRRARQLARPERGARTVEPAYLSVSMRGDVPRAMLGWDMRERELRQRLNFDSDTPLPTRQLWQIEIPAGMGFVPAYRLTLTRGARINGMDEDEDRRLGPDPMRVNEAELMLPRGSRLNITSVRTLSGGRQLIRATAEAGRRTCPSTEFVLEREQVAA